MGLGFNKPQDEAGKAWPSIMVGLFAAFAGILYGYGMQARSMSCSRLEVID